MKKSSWLLAGVLALGIAGVSIGCGEKGPDATATGGPKASADLKGEVHVDGSSTVEPIISANAEEFQKEYPGVKVTVGTSGTGGGFKKFINGELDIANASRPVQEKEATELKAKGIEYIELPIAFDGLSVVVHKDNTFVDHLTVAELKKIWEQGSKVKTWADVRPGWPKEEIHLYGPGTDSGTFDYFTEAICEKKGNSRADYQASEDDNTLVAGVSGDKNSLGYFGYAYYQQNQDKLKLVPIDGGKGPITASPETIKDGTYQPLSRPLFIYVSKSKLAQNPATKAFVLYILNEGRPLISDESVGYVQLTDEDYTAVIERFNKGTTGTVFHGTEPGLQIKDILARETGK